jgi:hypothetical protein
MYQENMRENRHATGASVTINSTAFIAITWREESSIREKCASGIPHSRYAGLHKGRLLTEELITAVKFMVHIRANKEPH